MNISISLAVNHRLQTSASICHHLSLSPYSPHPCLFYPHTIRETCMLILDPRLSSPTQRFNFRSNSNSLVTYIPVPLAKLFSSILASSSIYPKFLVILSFHHIPLKLLLIHFFTRETLLPLLLKRLPVSGPVPVAGVFFNVTKHFLLCRICLLFGCCRTTLAAIFDDAMDWRQ